MIPDGVPNVGAYAADYRRRQQCVARIDICFHTLLLWPLDTTSIIDMLWMSVEILTTPWWSRRLHNPNSLNRLLTDPQASADLKQRLLAVESANHKEGDSTETKVKKDFTAQVLALRGRRGSATIQHLGL